MSTQLGQMLSDWLRTGPGPFTGDSADESVEAARQSFGASRVPFQVFKERLNLAGYCPVQRLKHGSGNGAVYYLLALPENFAR